MKDAGRTIEIRLKRNPRHGLRNRLGLNHSRKSPTSFLAYCAFVRALKQAQPDLRKKSSVIVLSVSNGWSLKTLADFVEEILDVSDVQKLKLSSIAIYIHPTAREQKKAVIDDELEVRLHFRHLIVLKESDAKLLPELEIVADRLVEVDIGNRRDLAALARLRGNGDVNVEAARLLRQQSQSNLAAIFRQGVPLAKSLLKLQAPKARSSYDRSVLTLADLPGFGEASAWAESLRHDIAEWRSGKLGWSEVDKGVLMMGPPGTGKTMFAELLATTCGLTFVPSSLAQWQKKGHMGDLLKAMNQTFERAKEFAPSLLFIDEIDAIGNRETFSGDNANYMTEVLSGLLELVDGSLGREGVIVAGACNYPDKIDKALLRGGRLEKHIAFGLPDDDQRAEILRFYLPDTLADDALKELSKRLNGWTPADLERIARIARRTARNLNRPVVIEDLTAELPVVVPLQDATLRRVAVHEAGHAMIALSLSMALTEVSIQEHLDPADFHGVLGRTSAQFARGGIRTGRDYLDEISVSLAGTAAEEFFFDERTTMASGGDRSDLARATKLAFEMIEIFGLGDRLTIIPDQQIENIRQNPRLRGEIEELLQKQMLLVKAQIARFSTQVFELSEELLHSKIVTGERALEIFKGAAAPLGANIR